MVSLKTASKAQKEIAEYARTQRLQVNLTQQGLADRSGVPLPTLRKFEQTGLISLQSFLKIQMALGKLDHLLGALQVQTSAYTSIDDVLKDNTTPIRKRGRRP